jgi:hypothetical protein
VLNYLIISEFCREADGAEENQTYIYNKKE